MFLKNYHLTFISSLMFGSIIAITSNSWFLSWLGLEINLMSMIPLILIKLNKNLTEAAIKYFLAQALASVLLIFIISVNFYFLENISLEMTEIFMIVSLALKGGLAPFHFWFPQVSNLINWFQCLMIFTWQKIAPLLLMFSLNMKLIFVISILSALVGSLGGLNQNLMKLIMSYSSISHGAWMILGCSLSISSWFLYFLVYSFLSLTIISFLFNNQIINIKQIFTCSDSHLNKNILTMNILSLGGLPPLMGFTVKMIILVTAFKTKILFMFIPLIFSTLVSLFFYTRTLYSNFLSISNHPFNLFLYCKKSTNMLFSSSILFNIMFPALLVLN